MQKFPVVTRPRTINPSPVQHPKSANANPLRRTNNARAQYTKPITGHGKASIAFRPLHDVQRPNRPVSNKAIFRPIPKPIMIRRTSLVLPTIEVTRIAYTVFALLARALRYRLALAIFAVNGHICSVGIQRKGGSS